MNRSRLFAIVLVGPILLAGSASSAWAQSTIHVPGDYATIQDAIDAAIAGDTVLVEPGPYTGAGNKNLDFGGKDIIVRCDGAPGSCVIDCENLGRGFAFHSGETNDAVVDGFTITHGSVDSTTPGGGQGGGIRIKASSSPTITNCIISYNTIPDTVFSASGGGLFIRNSAPIISNCTISHNTTQGYYGNGAGICLWDSYALITNCTISDNSVLSHYDGGGIYSAGGTLTIANCDISGNSAKLEGGWGGGGVYLTDYCDATVTNCSVTGNEAVEGGGVYCRDGASATFDRCVIAGNRALGSGDRGGGIICSVNGSATMTNCLIVANEAYWGGGIALGVDGQAAVTNCTIVANVANWYGGGAFVYLSAQLSVSNSIFWGDTAGLEGPEIWCGPQCWISYSDVEGGEDAVAGPVQWGEGNINLDPLFANPAGPDGDPETWEENNYRLSATSPCVDAGNPVYVPEPGETDLDGRPRVLCGQVDMGAYESGIGDYNCDRVVDLTDFAAWGACMTGPDSGPYGEGCQAFDSELDGDVDLPDFAEFQTVFDP